MTTNNVPQKCEIKIKPLSVNNAYRGRRFLTDAYDIYKKHLLLILPKMEIPKGKLEIHYQFGLRKNADVDNPVKPLMDILQEKYGFNDSRVYRIIADKVIVKKGEEFLTFNILPFQEGLLAKIATWIRETITNVR